MTFFDTEIKELDRSIQINTHNTRSLIHTSHVCLRHKPAEAFIRQKYLRWESIYKFTYTQGTFPIKLRHNNNFDFLVNFNFVLSTWRISYVGSNFGQISSMFFMFSRYYFKLWKRTNLRFFFRKNIN